MPQVGGRLQVGATAAAAAATTAPAAAATTAAPAVAVERQPRDEDCRACGGGEGEERCQLGAAAAALLEWERRRRLAQGRQLIGRRHTLEGTGCLLQGTCVGGGEGLGREALQDLRLARRGAIWPLLVGADRLVELFDDLTEPLVVDRGEGAQLRARAVALEELRQLDAAGGGLVRARERRGVGGLVLAHGLG